MRPLFSTDYPPSLSAKIQPENAFHYRFNNKNVVKLSFIQFYRHDNNLFISKSRFLLH